MEHFGGEIENNSEEMLSPEAIVRTIDQWRTHPRVDDNRIRAFAKAFCDRMSTDDRLKQSVEFMVDYQTDPTTFEIGGTREPTVHTPEQAADQILRSLQHIGMILEEVPQLLDKLLEISQKLPDESKQVVGSPNPNYAFPRSYRKSAAWDSLIDYTLSNPYFHEMFDYDLSYRRVQTNVADRYKGIHLPMSILSEKYFPEQEISWLDIGTSIGLGPRAEIKGIPFSLNLGVKRQFPDLYSNDGFDYAKDNRLAGDWVKRLEAPINYAHIDGVDLTGFNDIIQIMWVRASYYPTELHIKSITRQFDTLRQIEDPKLDFHVANFADELSVARFSAETGDRKYDFVSAVTMHHQLGGTAEVLEFDRLAKSMLSENGFYIRQGFMHVNPASPTGLFFPKNWGALDYRTIIESPGINIPPTEIFQWQNARCNELVIPGDREVNRLLRSS